jgi:hypothetical protein
VIQRQRAHVRVILYFPETPDESDDVTSWQPRDPLDFGVHVQILAGTSEETAPDSFDILVCTPTWFAARWQQGIYGPERLAGGVIAGRHIWFMGRWDPNGFQRAIEHVLDLGTAGSWGEIANRLGRYAPWEYDYRYDRSQDRAAGLTPIDYPEPEP